MLRLQYRPALVRVYRALQEKPAKPSDLRHRLGLSSARMSELLREGRYLGLLVKAEGLYRALPLPEGEELPPEEPALHHRWGKSKPGNISLLEDYTDRVSAPMADDTPEPVVELCKHPDSVKPEDEEDPDEEKKPWERESPLVQAFMRLFAHGGR